MQEQITLPELWLPVDGWQETYEVSSFGRVRHRRTFHIKALNFSGRGYLFVHLDDGRHRKSVNVHRLVALAHVPNPNGMPEVNHLDGNKANNLAGNLEWTTRSGNLLHAYANRLKQHPSARLNDAQVQYIRNLPQGSRSIARAMAVPWSTFLAIRNRRLYAAVPAIAHGSGGLEK